MVVSSNGIRILLADEHSLFVKAVLGALEAHPGLNVVAEAQDGIRALSAAERTRPDVALLGASLPVYEGVQLTRMLRERSVPCPVVLIAESEDPTLLYQAMLAGARGYVSKASPLSVLVDSIQAVVGGDMYVPQQMLGDLLDRLIHRRTAQEQALRKVSRLTKRERVILALLAEGGNNERIAQILLISPQTARTHIQNVLTKLDVHSRLEAVAFVTRNGIVNELEEVAL